MMQLQMIVALFVAGLIHVRAAAVHQKADFLRPTNTSLALVHTRVLSDAWLEYWGEHSPNNTEHDWDSGWGDSSVPAIPLSPLLTPPSTNTDTTHHRRCGSNAIHCSTTNIADLPTCGELLSHLDANPRVAIYNAKAVIFYNPPWGCTIARHDSVPLLYNRDLLPAAQGTFSECAIPAQGGPGVSGWAMDVNLRGVCTKQCLAGSTPCF